MDPSKEIRMFVLLRNDMSYIDKLVYSNKSIIEYVTGNSLEIPFFRDCHDRQRHKIMDEYGKYMGRYADKHIGKYFKWNKKVIYLSVNDADELEHWGNKLVSWHVKFSQAFSDDGKLNSLACLGFNGDFKNTKPLQMPKGILSSIFG